jgi:hypothetical protein
MILYRHRNLLVSYFLVSLILQSYGITLSLSSTSHAASVLQWLDSENISWSYAKIPTHFQSKSSTFVELENSSILLHLIPGPTNLDETLPPTFNKRLTDWVSITKSQEGYNKIIHLHQDVWLAKNDIVKSRLLVQSGEGTPRRIFARKTNAKRVNATAAMAFLDENHLWGATRAKYYYGLFRENSKEHSNKRGAEEELVAVATFSARRKVQRDDRTFKSHELLRFCSQRDATVVGGISKLYKNFIRDVHPDDIVTVVDRDWGEGTGWHSMFETVSVMDPLIMVVNPKEPFVRRHLVGAGISNDNIESSKSRGDVRRLGLPMETLIALDAISNAQEALQQLAQDNFFPVYDTGVERLLMIVSKEDEQDSARMLWRNSQPKYARSYYSSNAGIASLLAYAATGSPPLDSLVDIEAIYSWKATSGTAASAKLLFSAPSSMNCNATVEVRQRANGWRTVGLVGGTKNPSIYHSIYKVDKTGQVEPKVVVSEYIKTMAVLSLAGQKALEQGRELRFLHFGYGAGTMVRFLAHYVGNSQHVAVELDEGVMDAAKHLLPDSPNVSVLAEDALLFSHHHVDAQPFDCICIDVFEENYEVPEQFYSITFWKNLSDHLLTPDGIMVQNFHSGGRRRGLVIENASKAASNVFEDFCWVPSLDSKPNAGNAILLASKVPFQEDGEGNIVQNLSRNALAVQSKCGFSFDAVARVQTAKRAI